LLVTCVIASGGGSPTDRLKERAKTIEQEIHCRYRLKRGSLSQTKRHVITISVLLLGTVRGEAKSEI